MSTIFGFDEGTVTAFDAAYQAWCPTAVQALFPMDPTQPARKTLAYQLAGEGYFIDVPIMVWNWDPYMTMYQRQIDGYTTYPDALDAQTKTVSTNIADYPPYVPPAGSPLLVGPQIGMSPYYYLTNAAVKANLPAGTETTQNGQSFVLQNIIQITGFSTQTIQRWILVG